MRVEVRADKKSIRVSGYVNVVGRDSRVLQDAAGGFIEQISPGAFERALKTGKPVELRFNHHKTLEAPDLRLKEDQIGLRAQATVVDPEVIAAAERNELRGWSFGFVKQKDHWKTDENGTRRRFVDDLELREVSILNVTPAYIATSIEARGEDKILIEFRADEMLDGGVDYIRETETKSSTKEKTITPESESMMAMIRKTVEYYTVKRRRDNAL